MEINKTSKKWNEILHVKGKPWTNRKRSTAEDNPNVYINIHYNHTYV